MSKKLLVFAGVLWISLFSWSAPAGKFSLFIKSFKTPQSTYARDVYVYLPQEYHQNTNQRYPVIYMHDGQNLYDPARAFMGQTWDAENTLNSLIRARAIPPVIVVGLDNTPERTIEYTPDIDLDVGEGGQADRYLKMIAVDLKSQVDQKLRTQSQRESTFMIGSSLGGLVSLYAGVKYSSVFGSVGALSPSLWWNDKSIFDFYALSFNLPSRIYLDSGTTGGEHADHVREFKTKLLPRYADPASIKTVIQTGASHSEYYWAQRLPYALKFLLNP